MIRAVRHIVKTYRTFGRTARIFAGHRHPYRPKIPVIMM